MDVRTFSGSQATILTAVISSSYVLSVFLSSLIARPGPPLWRNDPKVIKARSLLATASTLLSCLLVYLTVQSYSDETPFAIHDALQHLGIPLSLYSAFLETLKAYFIVPALFVGPIYATYLSQSLPLQENWRYDRGFISRFSTWEGFRNYLMVLWISLISTLVLTLQTKAPVTEELTYRSCILSIYKHAGYKKSHMIWCGPLWFGLAHVHHAFEVYIRLGKTAAALRTAFISTLFQFAYTTVFGWLCSFLFVRTGSIIVPISAHILCNIMGFPALTWELKQYPSHARSILLAYLFGVALFCYSLFPWSFNPHSIYWKA